MRGDVGQRMVRAMGLGLAASLGLATIGLGVSAIQKTQFVCERLTTEECDFERQTSKAIAKSQALAATGCAALSLGLFIIAKRKRP
jgi:hypothetical protein